MLERPALQPAIDGALTVDDVIAHLNAWRTDTAGTLDTLATLRQQAEAAARQLENPKAASDYLDFFSGFFTRVSEDLSGLIEQLNAGGTSATADLMRQIANNAAAEQRRTLAFRDKWVNKPLPYEQLRPLLTRMASDVRDQLADYRGLIAAADRVAALAPPPPGPEPKAESFDRRALFRRIVRPLGDDDSSGGSPSR